MVEALNMTRAELSKIRVKTQRYAYTGTISLVAVEKHGKYAQFLFEPKEGTWTWVIDGLRTRL